MMYNMVFTHFFNVHYSSSNNSTPCGGPFYHPVPCSQLTSLKPQKEHKPFSSPKYKDMISYVGVTQTQALQLYVVQMAALAKPARQASFCVQLQVSLPATCRHVDPVAQQSRSRHVARRAGTWIRILYVVIVHAFYSVVYAFPPYCA